MVKNLLKKQSPEDLASYLFILAMIMLVLVPPLYERQKKYARPVVGKELAHTAVAAPEIETEAPVVVSEIIAPTLHEKHGEALFHQIILHAANRYQINPALVKAIIMAESGYNPRAISKKGARGLMQLMPATAEALGVEDIFNPEHNINGGVKYFKQLLQRFNGDVELALAAYNAGSKKVKKYGGIPPFKTTRYYIKKVFEYYQYYKEQMSAKTDSA